MFSDIFSYVSHRIPEISDETYRIDQAMKAGFGWELGPFEIWDAIGAQAAYDKAIELRRDIAPWVKEMLDQGTSSFYQVEVDSMNYFDKEEKQYKALPYQEALIDLYVRKKANTIWKNDVASLIDLGDDVVNLEFHSKMNAVGGDTLQAFSMQLI